MNTKDHTVITIDCRQVAGSGIGTYISNLIAEFEKRELTQSIRLLVAKRDVPFVKDLTSFEIVEYNDPIYSISEQYKWLTKVDPFGTFHVPHYNAPLAYPGKLIVTVHDICHYTMKECFPGVLKRVYAGRFMPAVLKRADYIITVSNFTKSEIVKTFAISPEKIFVIHNGVNPFYQPVSRDLCLTMTEKLGLPEQYLLYVGNLKPHKNIIGLVSAYKRALQENIDLPPLVVLGDNRKMLKDLPALKAMLDDSVLKEKLIFTGYVDTQYLPAIYSHASIYLFPSLYEGFGLSLLEAMACGTPVIASRCSSIPEVVGDAAVLIDPYNESQLASAILELYDDVEQQQSCIIKGFKQVKKFSWQRAAEQHLRIYAAMTRSNLPSYSLKRALQDEYEIPNA